MERLFEAPDWTAAKRLRKACSKTGGTVDAAWLQLVLGLTNEPWRKLHFDSDASEATVGRTHVLWYSVLPNV